MTKFIFLVGALLCLTFAESQAGQYFQDFSAFSAGATNFNDGSLLVSGSATSVAGVVDNTFKELQLTAAGVNNTRTAFLLPDLDPGTAVTAFSIKWNSQIYGNFPNAADGFSLNFGQFGLTLQTNYQVETYRDGIRYPGYQFADGFSDGQTLTRYGPVIFDYLVTNNIPVRFPVTELRYYTNGPGGTPVFKNLTDVAGTPENFTNSYAQESGFGTGMSFCVQTYPQGSPGFFLRVNGAIIASATNNPSVQWGTNNTTRHFFEMDWRTDTGMTVRMDGQMIFTNVTMTGYTPQAGNRFVWAARTGGETEEVRVDNMVAITGGNLSEVNGGSPYFSSGGTPAQAFDHNPGTSWASGTLGSGQVGATLSSARQVRCYTVISSTDSQLRDPVTFVLQGSSNGTTWSSTNATASVRFQNRGETRAFLATDTTVYPDWRLSATALSGNYPTLAELRFYQFVPLPASITVPIQDYGVANSAGFTPTNLPFTFQVTPMDSANVTFEWGTNTSYDHTLYTNASGNSPVSLTLFVGRPPPGTNYYRITLTQTADDVPIQTTGVFVVPDFSPVVLASSLSQLDFFSPSRVQFDLSLNPFGNATVTFEWGTNASYGQSYVTNISGTAPLTLLIPIGTLSYGSNYYRVTVVQADGTTVQRISQFPDFIFQDGNALLTAAGTVPADGNVAWADMNFDGTMDLLLTGGYSTIGKDLYGYASALMNNFTGKYGTNSTTPLLNSSGLVEPPNSLMNGTAFFTDVNNDNRPDIFMSGESVIQYFNRDFVGGFLMGLEPTINVSPSPPTTMKSLRYIDGNSRFTIGCFSSAAVVDFNNDGRIDLLTEGARDSLGDVPVVGPPYVELNLNRAHAQERPDLGLDGYDYVDLVKPDLGLPGFEQTSLLSPSYHTLAAADYDNDGNMDVFACGPGNSSSDPGKAALYRNDGLGRFTKMITALPTNAMRAAWGDIDNDGKPDIIVQAGYFETNQTIQIFHNDGNGQFSDVHANLPGYHYANFSWGDLNHDGKLDLVLSATQYYPLITPYSAVYYNQGDGVFTKAMNLNDFGERTGQGVALVDMNNDGRLDISMIGSPYGLNFEFVGGNLQGQDGQLSFYFNLTSPSNQPPSAPVGLSSAVSQGTVVLNWGNAIDDVTPALALTYNLRVGKTPGGSEMVSPLCNPTNGFHLVPQPGNRQQAHTVTLRLPPGTYYWSVQAIDQGLADGPFAPEQTFTISTTGLPAAYPVTVSPATNGVQFSAVGWTGYDRTNAFFFQYGTNLNYGSATSPHLMATNPILTAFFGTNVYHLPATNAVGLHPDSIIVSNVTLNGITPYYCRLVVSNSLGVTYSQPVVFTATTSSVSQSTYYLPLTMSLLQNASNLTLSWPNQAYEYVLERSTNLASPNWESIEANPGFTGNGRVVTLPPTGSVAFYRLRR